MCNTYNSGMESVGRNEFKRSYSEDATKRSLNTFLRDGDGTGISSTATSAVAPVAAGATAIGKVL